MSKKIKVVLNRKGVRELLRSGEVQSMINRCVQQTASGAGDNFEGDTIAGKNRAVGIARAANGKGVAENKKSNVLLQALGRVRV